MARKANRKNKSYTRKINIRKEWIEKAKALKEAFEIERNSNDFIGAKSQLLLAYEDYEKAKANANSKQERQIWGNAGLKKQEITSYLKLINDIEDNDEYFKDEIREEIKEFQEKQNNQEIKQHYTDFFNIFFPKDKNETKSNSKQKKEFLKHYVWLRENDTENFKKRVTDKVTLAYSGVESKAEIKEIIFDSYKINDFLIPMEDTPFELIGLASEELHRIVCSLLDKNSYKVKVYINGETGKNSIIKDVDDFRKSGKTILIEKYREIYNAFSEKYQSDDWDITEQYNFKLRLIKVLILQRKNLPQGSIARPVSLTKDGIENVFNSDPKKTKYKGPYCVVETEKDCTFHAIIRAYIDGHFEKPSLSYKFNKVLIPEIIDEHYYISFPEFESEEMTLVTTIKNKERGIERFLKNNIETMIKHYKNLLMKQYHKEIWKEEDWSVNQIIDFFSNLFKIRIFRLNKIQQIMKAYDQDEINQSGDQILLIDIIKTKGGNRHCNYLKNINLIFGGYLCLFHMCDKEKCKKCIEKSKEKKQNKAHTYEDVIVSKEKEIKSSYKVIYWDIETIRTEPDREVFKRDFSNVENRIHIMQLTPYIVAMKYVVYSIENDSIYSDLSNEVKTFVGEDCILQFLKHLFNEKEYHSSNTILYAHNGGKFDILPLIHTLITKMNIYFNENSIMKSSGRYMEINVKNKNNCVFSFRDSCCHLQRSLKDLSETFELKHKKLEVIPYNWFTKEMVDDYLNKSEKEVDYKTLSKDYFDKESQEKLREVEEWKKFPIADYIEYCKEDVESLAEVFSKYSHLIYQILNTVPFDYYTLQSMGYNVLLTHIENECANFPENKEAKETYEKELKNYEYALQTAKDQGKTSAEIKKCRNNLYLFKKCKPHFGIDHIKQFNTSRVGKDELLFLKLLYKSDALVEDVEFPEGYTRQDIEKIDHQYEIKSLNCFVDFVVHFKDGKRFAIEYLEPYHNSPEQQAKDEERFAKLDKYFDFLVWTYPKAYFDKFLENYDQDELAKIKQDLEDNVYEIDPRNTLYGGRCESHCYYFDSDYDKYGCIKQDFTSLYPSVCYFMYLPLGGFEHFHRNESKIHSFENQLYQKMEEFKKRFPNSNEALEVLNTYDPKELNLMGLFFASCIVIPPNNLIVPIVPTRLNNKLTFPLCKKCTIDQNKERCNHTDEERSFRSDLCSPEIYAALYFGYKIKILDMYTISRYSNQVFRKFISKIIRIKTLASGKNDVKEDQIEIFKNAGINITKEEIYEKKNSGLREIAKLILNACSYGKFAENFKKSGVRIVDDVDEFIAMDQNESYEIKDFQPLNLKELKIVHEDLEISKGDKYKDEDENEYNDDDEQLLVSYEISDNAYDVYFDRTCCVLGSFITSYARIQLYRLINFLQTDSNAGRMLYCDTDCCVYQYSKDKIKSKNGIPKYMTYITGSFGITTELNDIHDYITKWVSLGPKAYLLFDNHYAIKGFSAKGVSKSSSYIMKKYEHSKSLKEKENEELLLKAWHTYLLLKKISYGEERRLLKEIWEKYVCKEEKIDELDEYVKPKSLEQDKEQKRLLFEVKRNNTLKDNLTKKQKALLDQKPLLEAWHDCVKIENLTKEEEQQMLLETWKNYVYLKEITHHEKQKLLLEEINNYMHMENLTQEEQQKLLESMKKYVQPKNLKEDEEQKILLDLWKKYGKLEEQKLLFEIKYNYVHSNNLLKKEEQELLFEIWSKYVLSKFQEEYKPIFFQKNAFFRSSSTFNLYQFDTIRILNVTEHKRRIIWTKDKEKNGVFTVPFGYAENLIAENFSECLLDDEEQ